MFDLISLIIIVAFAFGVRQLSIAESPFAVTFFLGFLLIGAYFFGVSTAKLRLPKISGYILAGILFGPFSLQIVSAENIDKLRLIDGIALTLIALIAGGELRIENLRKQLRSILYVLSFQIIFVFLGIAGLVYVFRDYFSLTQGQPQQIVLSISVLLGVVAVAKSPATTIAIINEYKARGPMTNVVLGVTVLKDVVVLMFFAIALSVSKTLIYSSQSLDIVFLQKLLSEIGLSLLVGVGVGGLFGFYLKYIKAEAEIFLLLAVLLIAQFAPIFHLDALLLCIAAGFVVQNFSKQGEKFIEAIEKSVLPVFVLFFSLAGASLDLGALFQMWPFALLLAILRIFFTFVGTWTGASAAHDPVAVKRYAWMGFIAQAGVTLGMAILVEKAFQGWGAQLKTLIVAIIALNQVLGPIFFRFGLFKAKETAEFHRLR